MRMKLNPLIAFIALFTFWGAKSYSQSNIEWPQTPSAEIFQSFVSAYNSGNRNQIGKFAKSSYANTDEAYLAEKVEYWLDIYHRFGAIKPYSISINQPKDIEVWVQGTVSKAWFAPEFILDDNYKIKATGMLQGMQPPNVVTPAPSNELFLERIINYLDTNEKKGLFQGSVLLHQNGKSILHKAYGNKNLESGQMNTIDTRFDIVSITKVLTAISILQLVQNGSLELFDPIDQYVPELPIQLSKNINIFQLLTHTSYYKLKHLVGFKEAIADTQDLDEVLAVHLQHIPKLEDYPNFVSSQKWNYSNQGYDLLAIIVENVTGKTFDSYLQSQLFDLAGMLNTSFDQTINTALPYRYDLDHGGLKDHSAYPSFFGRISGAAQLYSTTSDLLQLFQVINNNDILLDDSYKHLLYAPLVSRGGSDKQGLGMEISHEPVLSYGHSGVNVGSNSALYYFPEFDLTLVALCNNRSGATNLYNFIKNNLPD